MMGNYMKSLHLHWSMLRVLLVSVFIFTQISLMPMAQAKRHKTPLPRQSTQIRMSEATSVIKLTPLASTKAQLKKAGKMNSEPDQVDMYGVVLSVKNAKPKPGADSDTDMLNPIQQDETLQKV